MRFAEKLILPQKIPKQYLKDNGFERNQYNQEANYAYLDRPVNVSIGKQALIDYFRIAREQCKTRWLNVDYNRY